MRFFRFVSLIFVVYVFSACSTASLDKLDDFYYTQGDFQKAYDYASGYYDEDFLWAFQSGILAFQNGDFAKGTEYLDISEAFYEEIAGENFGIDALKTTASVLLSNGMFDYTGNLYEAVFANYYKALNYAMSGDYAKSRVEFNRANDRQRRSKEFFAAQIREYSKNLNENRNEYNSKASNVDNSRTYAKIDDLINSQYNNLNAFKAYDGYINPFVSYVSGVFFLTQGDFSKARDLLKEAYAISGSRNIAKDIEILESRAKSGFIFNKNPQDFSNFSGSDKKVESYTWIFIEDGRSPKKEELRLDFPMFLLTSNILMINIALPRLQNGVKTSDTYSLKSSNGNLNYSFEVSNMDNIVANEFKVSLPYVITTSVLSSLYKAYLQHFLSEQFGFFGTLGGAIFSKITTNADIRIARILPSHQLALRIPNTQSEFSLHSNRKMLYNFKLDSNCEDLCLNRDNIIYIRSLNSGVAVLKRSIGFDKIQKTQGEE